MSPTPSAPVTVIIPMYQAARYIVEALDSIRAQTLRPERVIVADDGSTDNGPDLVAARSDVELLRRPHTGINPTVEAGLSLARTEFVAFLDADDRWTPEKTRLQLDYLRARPEVGMVFGHARRFVMTPDGGEQNLDVVPGLTRCGGLFRRTLFDRINYLTNNEDSHEFLNWFTRAQEAGVVTHTLPDVVFERRIHGANHGILNRAEQRRAYFTTIKAALDRRRAQS